MSRTAMPPRLRRPADDKELVPRVMVRLVGALMLTVLALVTAARLTDRPLDADEVGRFLDDQADLPTKGRPRWVRLLADLDELPRTATTKVVKRELAAQGPVAGRGRLLERDERGTAYADVTEVTDVAEVLDQV